LVALREFKRRCPRGRAVRQQFLDGSTLASHSEGCAASWASLLKGWRWSGARNARTWEHWRFRAAYRPRIGDW